MRRTSRVVVTRSVLIASLIVVVEAGPRLGLIDPLTLVPLSTMITTSVDLLRSGELWPHLTATTVSVALSTAVAIVVGIGFGWLLWRFKTIDRAVSPYLISFYALPFFAFYPALIGVMGLNRGPILFIASGWAIVAVGLATHSGLSAIPVSIHKVSRTYQLSPMRSFVSVLLPAALPFIFSGVKLAVTLAVVSVIASEFILAGEGLGWFVSFAYNSFALERMYAGIVAVLVLATVVQVGVGQLERKLWPSRQNRVQT